MKLGIMQPYFMPYIGYFQLMHVVDEFVLYDNIQLSKAGWTRRNRILVNNSDRMLSLPLKSASDYLDIGERYLATSFPKERVKLLRQIEAAYRKAPYFSIAMPLIEQCLQYEEQNLFKFIFHSLLLIRDYLEISTKFIVSSEVKVEPHFKGQERVIAICTTLNANHYVNAIGGVGLYTKSTFALQGITLSFIKSKPLIYQQFSNTFVPNLSIIDVIMFNSSHTIQTYLEAYELI